MTIASHLSLKPGEVVDSKFRIGRRLGAGGLGSVYSAWDLLTERGVAIKMLDAGPQTRLFAEAAALASVSSRNVVQLYGAGWHRSRPYLVMELVEGDALASHREWDLHAQLSFLSQVCLGLADVHAAGLLHRDIKPANTLVERGTGRVVLLDFGAACAWSAARDSIVGTPDYLAPELLMGELATVAADVYSVGVLAYEFLTGVNPFFDDSVTRTLERHLTFAPDPPSRLRPRLGPCDALILAAIDKSPGNRPTSALSLAHALEASAASIRQDGAWDLGPAKPREQPGQSTPTTVTLHIPQRLRRGAGS